MHTSKGFSQLKHHVYVNYIKVEQLGMFVKSYKGGRKDRAMDVD